MSRRSASDAIKGTQVKVEDTAAEETKVATPEVDAKGADAGKVDSPDAEGQEPAKTEDQDTPDADADADSEDEHDGWDMVEATVTADAFNYFVDGVHVTARKGDRIELDQDDADRAVSLGAVEVD